jgi:hypothetical protein
MTEELVIPRRAIEVSSTTIILAFGQTARAGLEFIVSGNKRLARITLRGRDSSDPSHSGIPGDKRNYQQ